MAGDGGFGALAGSLIRTHVGLRFLKKVWRATADTGANFFIRFSVKKRRLKAEKSLDRPHVQVLLERAEMWASLLDSGEVKTRVELAKRFGVAAGRVSNIMNLLKLAPEVQAFIRALPVGEQTRRWVRRGISAPTSGVPCLTV